MITPQQRGAQTRKQNAAGWKLYQEVTKPAHIKVEKLLNGFLESNKVKVRYVGERRLKNGVTLGTLMKIDHGGLGFTVWIDGYVQPQHFSSRFWELA